MPPGWQGGGHIPAPAPPRGNPQYFGPSGPWRHRYLSVAWYLSGPTDSPSWTRCGYSRITRLRPRHLGLWWGGGGWGGGWRGGGVYKQKHYYQTHHILAKRRWRRKGGCDESSSGGSLYTLISSSFVIQGKGRARITLSLSRSLSLLALLSYLIHIPSSSSIPAVVVVVVVVVWLTRECPLIELIGHSPHCLLISLWIDR